MSKIIIIGNNEKTIFVFRRGLISKLVAKDYEVFVFAPFETVEYQSKIKQLGAIPINIEMNRTGKSPIADLRYLYSLYMNIKKIDPDIVLSSFVKPNIYGMIASKLNRIDKKLAMVEGVGHIFIQEGQEGLKEKLLRKCVELLYQLSFSIADSVLMLNYDDQELFVDKGIVKEEKVRMIPGIGVDLEEFKGRSEISPEYNFIYVGRMIEEKGLNELVSATKILNKNFSDIKVALVGGVDSNPTSLDRQELKKLYDETNGAVHWIGYVSNVKEYINSSSVFVLPSYREGLPRSTQEAMAMGKPIITTEVPGCRDTVEHKENGFLVPPREPNALADVMKMFINNSELVNKMGKKSRELAEKKYDQDKINELIISLME